MYCKHCGKEIKEGVKFCKYCGESLAISPETVETTTEIIYASFWIRFGAWIIDVGIITILLILFLIIFEIEFFWEENLDALITLIGIIIYHTFFLSIFSSTPGKILYGLWVVDINTKEKIKFGKALGRSLSYILSNFVFGLGFLWIAFDREKHQGWHDKIAKTLVIKKTKKSLVLPIIFSVIATGFLLWGIFSEEPGYGYLDYEWIPRYGTKQFPISDIEDEILRENLLSVVFLSCYDEYLDLWAEGSGVLFNPEGYILTNYHIIEGTDYCEVGLPTDLSRPPDLEYYAISLAHDETLDIAVLEITSSFTTQMPRQFSFVENIGSSDTLSIGENVTLVGYPAFGGFTLTLTEGVVSGRLGDDFIKISAKIDEGNSGGALFNQAGELVGIASFGLYGAFEGLGYAIGIDSIEEWFMSYE